jgi:hypothetical protein
MNHRMRLILPIIIILTTAFACTETAPPKEWSVKETLLDKNVEMAPLAWHSFPFKINEKGSRVNGSFDTGTDKSYPIMFYVTDPESAITLKERDVGSYDYRSVNSRGTTYSAAIVKELDPGDYVFLFHNESESESRKVNIKMSVER